MLDDGGKAAASSCCQFSAGGRCNEWHYPHLHVGQAVTTRIGLAMYAGKAGGVLLIFEL